MIKGEHAELTKIATGNVCGECGALLDVATQGESGTFALRCGNGHYPDMVRRAPTLSQRSKQGEQLPATATYHHLPEEDLGTGAKLSNLQIGALINYAHRYGLDPYRGHVMIMHGKPYVGLDGYLYHANRLKIPYNLRSRPLTPAEREAMQLGPKDQGWGCEITRLDSQEYRLGIGIVTAEEMTELSKKDPSKLRSPVVAAHPWQLAQKRAEWQALRRAFPIGEEMEEKENGK